MANDDFHMETSKQGRITVLKPTGWVSPGERSLLTERLVELLESRTSMVIMDLSDVEFSTPSEFGAFLYFERRFTERGKRLVFASPNWKMLRLLRTCNFDKALTICGTLEEASALVEERSGSPARGANLSLIE